MLKNYILKLKLIIERLSLIFKDILFTSIFMLNSKKIKTRILNITPNWLFLAKVNTLNLQNYKIENLGPSPINFKKKKTS